MLVPGHCASSAASIKAALPAFCSPRGGRAMLSAQKSATLRQLSYASADVNRRYRADLPDSASRAGDKTAKILGAFPARTHGTRVLGHFWLLYDALIRATASHCSEEQLLQATQETAA